MVQLLFTEKNMLPQADLTVATADAEEILYFR